MKIQCQNCGVEMDDAARFCEKCGCEAKGFVENANGMDWVEATTEDPMTHCDKCKKQVQLHGDEKCPYCGAEIHEPTGPVCPRCGTQMQDAVRTCVVCGEDIPGRYDKKPAKRILRWMVYRKPNGQFGIGIVGWIVLTILVLVIMGIILIVEMIAA